MTSAYIITWERYSLPYNIDVNSEEAARAIAIQLAELGRSNIRLTFVEYDEDPELKRRIWARVQARIADPPLEVFK